jgi:hypothetical protein
MAWVSSGRVVNPVLDQVLCDSGALPAGSRYVTVYGSATVAAVFELQLRNAANSATLKSQILAVPASGTNQLNESVTSFPMADQERLRIIQVAAVTGSVSVSMHHTD